MAAARLIPKAIYRSKTFLKLPVTAQNLMTFLILESDNDGIVEAYGVMRMIGASDDDLRVLAERGMVYVLNEEWITYICNFQKINKLDPRNFQISKHRSLLVRLHPEIEKELVEPIRRTKSKEIPRNPMGSLEEGKGSKVKGSESLYSPQKKINIESMMRTDYDYSAIERTILGH